MVAHVAIPNKTPGLTGSGQILPTGPSCCGKKEGSSLKRYCIRLGLLAGSMLMALAGNLIALAAAIAGSNRAWPVAVANDQALNAALVGRMGSEDETISSRAGKAARNGKRWGCLLCRLLDRIDPGHCETSIEQGEGETPPAGTTPRTGSKRSGT